MAREELCTSAVVALGFAHPLCLRLRRQPLFWGKEAFSVLLELRVCRENGG